MSRTTPFVAALVSVSLTACGALHPEAAAQNSTLFAGRWNSGLDAREPRFHTQAIDGDTFAIRQSIHTSFEAPFVYLIFGADKALLIDTGDKGGDLRAEIDRLIGERLAASGRERISLVVMHTHGHSDHVAGDVGFADRADTTVVGHSAEDVAAFFGIDAWPAGSAAYDLGGRIVDILPTPGHHASHVMVFDRATRVLFSGDAVYPGLLRFRCESAAEYLASIDRISAFAADHDVAWLLGGHVEMKAAPGQYFNSNDRARRNEHALELPPSLLPEIREAVRNMGDRPRVEAHDDFVLFPHPANPQGLQPPDWCQARGSRAG